MTYSGPLFSWGNAGTANSLEYLLNSKIERAVAQAEGVSAADAVDAAARIVAGQRVEPVQLDLQAVDTPAIEEIALAHNAGHRIEAKIVYPPPTDVDELLAFHPKDWPQDRRMSAYLRPSGIDLSQQFDPETVTADEIRAWRDKTKTDFAELIAFINAKVTAANEALPGAVEAVLTPRLGQLARLRALRAELGEDPDAAPTSRANPTDLGLGRTSLDW